MTNQIWRVGAVEITKLVEAEFTFPSENTGKLIPDADPTSVLTIPWIAPFATPEGRLRGSIHLLLVQTPTARIIVDTGIGNDKTRNLPLFSMRTTPVLDFLRAAGWSWESVDHVICTHLHLDHVGWNTVRQDDKWVPTFPQPRWSGITAASIELTCCSSMNSDMFPSNAKQPTCCSNSSRNDTSDAASH